MQVAMSALTWGAGVVIKKACKAAFGSGQNEDIGNDDEFKPDAITCLFLLALYQYLPDDTAIHFNARSLEFQIPGESYIPLPITRWSNGDSRLDTFKILIIVQKALSVIPPNKIVYPPEEVSPTDGEKEVPPASGIAGKDTQVLNRSDDEEYTYYEPITNIWLQNLVAIRRLQLHYGFKLDPLPSLKKETDQTIFSEGAKADWTIQNEKNVKIEEDRRASDCLHQAYMLIMEALVKEEGTPKSIRESPYKEFIEEYRETLSESNIIWINNRLKKLKKKIPQTPPKTFECKAIVDKYTEFCKKRVTKFNKLIERRSEY